MDNKYGFRLWQKKRKVWRRVTEVCQRYSYVSVCYDAGEEIEWLGRSPGYSLEHLRNPGFERAIPKLGLEPGVLRAAMPAVAQSHTARASGPGYGCVRSVFPIFGLRCSGESVRTILASSDEYLL